MNSIACKCYAELRRIKSFRRFSPTDAARTLVNSLVVSKNDYCNYLLAGMPANLMDMLQSVMNAAARIVCGLKKYDHITSHKRDSLHRLRVPQLVTFMLSLLTHKSPHGCAPDYLTELCIPVARSEPVRNLRSAAVGDLIISEQQYRSATGPSHMLDHKHGTVFHHSWEPQRLGLCSNQLLETHLFEQSYGQSKWHIFQLNLLNSLIIFII